MDLSTVVGIVVAFALMIGAIVMGGPLTIFINIPSLVIVVGGTIGATLVHYPFGEFFRAMSIFKKAFFHKNQTPKETVSQLIRFAGKARKEGILALQSVMGEVEDPFFLKSLQMAVDGQEAEDLKSMLDREIEYIMERHESGAELFVQMGTYAPALGMIGTLIGLVQMLQTMSDPSSIGPAMAVALLTTFYGAIIANIICMPVAGKLRGRSSEEVLRKTLIAEGMRCVLTGENPRIMEQRLHAFLQPKERESNFNKKD
ncbi:chemotaxis protein MotA [Desulfuromonas versatilis]|uniref:Chemotaxis protein MotA n=1 Tax=Desulfuromonas versatilis TaxID=2802975 RepID=A0ABN6E2T4_9BACT|nr:MotA/TolQ/ExbB proton channel family protein [Desulfuromonas versatilis]BCR06628.1 chemotaxis protein MotA [Desulfuromonas versatilis]